jgi:sugar phosphate permease
MVGLPGLLLAALCTLLPDDAPHRDTPSASAGYREVWSVPSFRLITFAGAAMTFALGGFAVWMPTFFHRTYLLSVGRAGALFGALTVLGGLVGSLLGGWISDRLRPRFHDADLLVSGAGLIAGMPLAAAAIMAPSLHFSIAALFLAETFLFLNMGPLNSAIVSVTRLETRSMAFAANILVIHLLGDAASPTLIGWGSDTFGLSRAMLLACAALGLGGVFCFVARAGFAADQQRASGAAA